MSDDDDFLMGGDTHDGPRLRYLNIDHRTGLFVNKGQEVYTPQVSIEGTPLLIIPRRTFWKPREMRTDGDNPGPLCKSPNAVYGYPSPDFPWATPLPGGGRMDRSLAVPRKIEPTPQMPDGFDSGEHVTLECASCPFAQWGPAKQPPLCKDAYLLGIMTVEDEQLEHGGVTAIEFSGGAARNLKDYASWFKRKQLPMFAKNVSIELNRMSTRGNTFASPHFTPRAETVASFSDFYADWARWFRASALNSFRPPAPKRTESTGFDGIL